MKKLSLELFIVVLFLVGCGVARGDSYTARACSTSYFTLAASQVFVNEVVIPSTGGLLDSMTVSTMNGASSSRMWAVVYDTTISAEKIIPVSSPFLVRSDTCSPTEGGSFTSRMLRFTEAAYTLTGDKKYFFGIWDSVGGFWLETSVRSGSGSPPDSIYFDATASSLWESMTWSRNTANTHLCMTIYYTPPPPVVGLPIGTGAVFGTGAVVGKK